MKNKIKLIFLIAFMTSCADSKYEVNVEDSNEEIQRKSLIINPLGTSWDDVLKYCRELQSCEVYKTKGYRYAPNGYSRKNPVIGVAHMMHRMGSYANTPYTNISKTIYWGFDEKMNLIHIWIRQDIDAP